MKTKKKLFLLTILSSFMLVGGTVAAYIVTDNADPFGIKITPGELTEVGTGSITLEWGSTMNISNVSNLGVGESVDRTISLKASGQNKNEDGTTTAIEQYVGSLSLTLIDLSGKGNTDDSLIHYLSVELLNESALVAKIPTEQAEFSLITNAIGTPQGKEYTLRITLNESASPVYSSIKNDVVYLQVDWNKALNDENEANAHTIYANKPSTWATLYAYAYKGSTINAAWPGVEMTYDEGTGLYTYDVLSSFDYVIFNDGDSQQYPLNGEEGTQTGFTASDFVDTPYFDFTDKTWKTEIVNRESLLADYYLVGTMTQWDYDEAYAFSANESAEGEYMLLGVTLTKGTEFKVRSATGEGGNNGFYGDAYVNSVIPEDGTYDIYFRPAGNPLWTNNGGYFYVAQSSTN